VIAEHVALVVLEPFTDDDDFVGTARDAHDAVTC
jgi:hypothetical protein